MVDNIKEEFFDFMEDLATLSPTIISPEPIQPQITYYFGQNQENEQKTVQPTPMLPIDEAEKQFQFIGQTQNFESEVLLDYYKTLIHDIKHNPVQSFPQPYPQTYQQPFFTKPTTQSGNLIKIIEGFHIKPEKRQPGGSDNKQPLPKHVIELYANKLPFNIHPGSLFCRAEVYGYDRERKNKIRLGEVGEKQFEENNDGFQKRWLAVFDNMIIKFSSHFNGQWLSLRFSLVDSNKNAIYYVDSKDFQTITQRGKEKQEEKKRKIYDNYPTEAKVEDVTPCLGSIKGGQLVKITGTGFICPPTKQPLVKFGDKPTKEVYSIKRNVIICETPEGTPGIVNVMVSFDKKNFIPSNAKFQYVNPNDPKGIELLLNHLFKPDSKTLPNKFINKGNQQGSQSMFT